jgi:hypothetical protein
MTPAPTVPVYVFGLEWLGSFTVDLVNPSDVWGSGFPQDKYLLLDPDWSTTFYIPGYIKDIDIKFDLQSQHAIQGVAVETWYYTTVPSVQVGVRRDESTAWTWYDAGSVLYLNERAEFTIPLTTARYVTIRLLGGNLWGDRTWGIKHIQIKGSLDPNTGT